MIWYNHDVIYICDFRGPMMISWSAYHILFQIFLQSFVLSQSQLVISWLNICDIIPTVKSQCVITNVWYHRANFWNMVSQWYHRFLWNILKKTSCLPDEERPPCMALIPKLSPSFLFLSFWGPNLLSCCLLKFSKPTG